MKKEKLKKIYICVFAIFVGLLVSFYFLAGDELKYRDSRYCIPMIEDKDASTSELTEGVVIEQRFINLVNRLKSVSFECTTHYRENDGYLTVVLLDGNNELGRDVFEVSKIKEGEPVTLELKDYLEGYTGKELTLRLTANSTSGKGVSPLQNSSSIVGTGLDENHRTLYGALAFSTFGQEYIFTGQYYWLMAGIISFVFGLVLITSYLKFVKKHTGYIVGAIMAIEKYWFLISQLVSRDFKTKYKRSILGVFWSFLNPLLTMLVQYIVFSTIFKSDVKNYPAYLLAGIICFSFFNEVSGMCLQSISGNANLIKKVYMPRYIFPLSRTLSSSINLAISLIPMLLVAFMTGIHPSKSFILMIFFLVCLIVFSLGVGMVLSTLMVFFRDTQFLWSVVCMAWMYATPIFYSESIIPEKFYFIVRFNPLYHFIKNIRICLINGISPEPRAYAYCFIFALVSLLLGSFIFKKNQDKFTLYL